MNEKGPSYDQAKLNWVDIKDYVVDEVMQLGILPLNYTVVTMIINLLGGEVTSGELKNLLGYVMHSIRVDPFLGQPQLEDLILQAYDWGQIELVEDNKIFDRKIWRLKQA